MKTQDLIDQTAEKETSAAVDDTRNYTKQYLRYVGIFVVGVLLIVAAFGRVELHSELERQILPHTLIGYVDDVRYFETVRIQASEWPDWAAAFEVPDVVSVDFESDCFGGRIGIFADLVYYENRYEKRSWLTGHLFTQASEYYYKPEGVLYLEKVSAYNQVPEVPLDEIVPQGYDFMAFRGNEV